MPAQRRTRTPGSWATRRSAPRALWPGPCSRIRAPVAARLLPPSRRSWWRDFTRTELVARRADRPRAAALQIQRDRPPEPAGRIGPADLQRQRSVVVHRGVELEQQECALGGTEAG